MQNATRYTTYKDFFPYYLREHRKRETRVLHYFGTVVSNVLLWTLIFTQNYYFILLILVAGYGPAWIGHFFIEKNRPATFTYPWWSYIGDHHMLYLLVRGRLKKALHNAGVEA